MAQAVQASPTDRITTEQTRTTWPIYYRAGAVAALLVVVTMVTEIFITFLPGGGADGIQTIVDWYTLYQESWFMGMRNMGLLNIISVTLGLVVTVGLFGALRRTNEPIMLLALVLTGVGAAIFFGTNRAFALLELSTQYAAASTAADRAVLEAAGQAMLAVGRSHAPGTFLGFIIPSIGSLMVCALMLRSPYFSTATAIVGLAGYTLLMLFEVSAFFVLALSASQMMFAGVGGILVLVWHVLVALVLLRLSRAEG